MLSLMNSEGTWKLIQRIFSCSFGCLILLDSLTVAGDSGGCCESSVDRMEHFWCILSLALMLLIHLLNEQVPTHRMAQLC